MATMLRKSLFVFLTLALTACGVARAPQPPSENVAGKVSVHGSGQAGVEVLAWPATALSLGGRAPYRSGLSADDGGFRMQLPPGEYYFLARGKGQYAYYGRNPVIVPEKGLSDLKIGLVPIPTVPSTGEIGIKSGVSGTVLVDNVPLAGSVVYVYTDLTTRFKGMGYAMSTPTDVDGRFEIPLPAGTYYLLARMRQGGGMATGPLKAGDFIGYAPVNPVRIEEGRVALVAIPLLEVPEKVGQLSESLFGQTSIRGRILDRDGLPVAGARAILYDEPQMLNRPLYVSQPSAADGSFVLSFPVGGTYYLAARQQLGGAPAPGELYGTWDGTPDHSLKITTGEQINGLELKVEEMW